MLRTNNSEVWSLNTWYINFRWISFSFFYYRRIFSSHYRKCEAHLSINDTAFNHSRPYLNFMPHNSYKYIFFVGYNLGSIYRFGVRFIVMRWMKNCAQYTSYTLEYTDQKMGFPNFISFLNKKMCFLHCQLGWTLTQRFPIIVTACKF